MMPRLLSFVLRLSGTVAALLSVIVIAAAWPARSVLVADWPDRIEEILTESGQGRIKRHFVPAGTRPPCEEAGVLARKRSMNIWQREMQGGRTVYGWMRGVVDRAGRVQRGLPGGRRQA